MKSRWRVSSTPVGCEMVYQVYRMLDVNAVDHSGNREYDKLYDNAEDAIERAKELNEQTEE